LEIFKKLQIPNQRISFLWDIKIEIAKDFFIITNDGGLTNLIMHPRYYYEKIYCFCLSYPRS